MPRVALPPIAQSADELLRLRQGERDERRRERRHLLWLLASGAAKDRQSAARQLGRNRETVSRWLGAYTEGGLAALLRAPLRPGPANQGGLVLGAEAAGDPCPPGRAAGRARLPGAVAVGADGTRSFPELLALSPLGARPTWRDAQGGAQKPRTKKEAELVAFRDAGLQEKLSAVAAAHPGQRVRLWCQDESRFGLQTIQRRRLTLAGVKPVCPFEQAFENFWLCGAVEPNTGEGFVLALPATDGDCLQVFLDQFAATHAQDPREVHAILMDNGGAHHAKALRWPARVGPIYLPAYCPELNPIERWWQELKDALSNQLFGTLDALRARLDWELAAWHQDPVRLCSLTRYSYLIDALAVLD